MKLSRLREHFGTAGLVVAIVALVAALGGGAYAASGGSGAGKATASAAKQGKQGKQGKTGKTGPAGPAGPAGPQGPAGAKGDAGAVGKDGTSGVDGKSVEVEAASVAECEVGGSKFKVGGVTKGHACNGEEGPPGPPGPTCENGECLLPSGATETGVWAVTGTGPEVFVSTSISFPLRLSQAPAATIFVTAEEQINQTAPAACPGSTEEPKAAAETLCLYGLFEENVGPASPFGFQADGRSGRILKFQRKSAVAEPMNSIGSWAVTAP